MTVRIRHVVPTVGASAPPQLQQVQQITIESIERSVAFTRPEFDVEAFSVHFHDEVVVSGGLTDCPSLQRSILDLGNFAIPRRLPLLADVLAALDDPSEYDVAVYTNADIAVQPYFYELIGELMASGYDAISITRRTVHPPFGSTAAPVLAAQVGTPHPGHDCFVMRSSIVEQLDVGEVALGVRYVGRAFLWALQLAAPRYRTFGDLHGTFHVGDDRAWSDARLDDYLEHNTQAVTQVVRRHVSRWGRARVSRLFGVRPFIDALETTTPPRVPAPRTEPFTAEHRRSIGGAHRFVFSANPGRSGSEFLARLIGAAEHTDAGHERVPTMTGPWLRQIAHEGPEGSYEQRSVKVEAIVSELEQLPASWTYVDTSHMFVKTFADVVFDAFDHELISVVVLRRDPVSVVRSFFELDYFGVGRNAAWIDWMVSPTAPHSWFNLDPIEVRDQFDLIAAYLVGIEARTHQLRETTPSVRWIDVRLEEITRPEGATRLFRRLDLKPPPGLDDLVATPINARTLRKEEVARSIDATEVRERLDDFLSRHRSRPEVELYCRNQPLTDVAT
jgi:hypothetical protein